MEKTTTLNGKRIHEIIQIILLVLIIIGIILLCTESIWVPKLVEIILARENGRTLTATDYKNSTYTIDGKPITLVNGEGVVADTLGSASKTIIRYFGNEAFGDLNGDGTPDVAFIITLDNGGSGTFYYAVVALRTSYGYQGTNAIFIGDRIAPETTEIRNGQLIVNYADRASGEPMTSKPSVGVSRYLVVHGTTLETFQHDSK